jgi:hypothetical protein
MVKVILIAGYARSGSTALGVKFAQENKNSIFLGEVAGFFFENRTGGEGSEKSCSCGKDIDECEFWRDRPRTKNLDIFYKWILKKVKKLGYNVIIDNSKRLQGLKQWQKLVQPEVYYSYRDPLDWAISTRNSLIRRNRKPVSVWQCFFRFFYHNLKELKVSRLTKNNYTAVKVEHVDFNKKKINHHIAFSNRCKIGLK